MNKFYLVLGTSLALLSCQSQSQLADISSEENGEGKSQTTKDLESALSGESQANRKYAAFAKIADQQNYAHVATLWRAASAAEGVHAVNYMKILGLIKSTKENLKEAVEGEQYEFSTMYPKFIQTAKDAGQTDAAQKMEWAFKVEQIHNKLFRDALEKMQKGEQITAMVYWICGVCGNTVPNTPPSVCNICGSPKSAFFEVK